LQLCRPDVVDIGPDDVHEGAGLIGRAAGLAFFGRAHPAELAGELGRGLGVDVEEDGADRGQDQDPDAAAGHADRSEAAPVIDVAAAPSALPTHVRSLR
jgi:hypothetical protein